MTLTRSCQLMLVLALGLAACRSQAYQKSVLARAKSLQTSPVYQIGESDTLTIQVLDGTPDAEPYSITATIRPDGRFAYPGHGDIDAKNKTPGQLQAEIAAILKKQLGLKNPNVFVEVNTFGSKRIAVVGEVDQPRFLPYTGQIRVVDALAQTGDWRQSYIRAAPNRTLLFRDVGGETKIYRVRLKDFFTKGDFGTNYYMRPGDYLFVPRNNFAIVGDTLAKWVLPLSGLLSFLNFSTTTSNVFVP